MNLNFTGDLLNIFQNDRDIMIKQYHILNGDALMARFPCEIDGETIVFRECLVDGDEYPETLEEFFKCRALFLSQSYGTLKTDYYTDVVPEFDRISHIEEHSEINLWFEDDLFCQVNFWFVVNLLAKRNIVNPIYLVRPESNIVYGFGGLKESELISILQNRTRLTEIEEISGFMGILPAE